MELLDTTADIDTPERVRFRHRLADPGPRAMAWVVDALVKVMLVVAVLVPVSLFASLPGMGEAAMGPVFAAMFVIEWFYGVGFETLLSGRTPGKMAMGLRVVRVDGAPIAFGDALLRNLMRAADFLPLFYGIGVFTMAADPRMRRLGDLVAGTVVVDERPATEVLGGVVIDPPVTEDERRELPARVDLRHDELVVIESFLRRRARFTPERVEELAVLLGPSIAERTGVEAPTWERVLTLAYARALGKDRAP